MGVTHRILSQTNSFLNSRSVEAYIVGGYVRDSIIGQVSRDIDIAIFSSNPQIVNDLATAIGGKLVDLDESRQISRIIINDEYPEGINNPYVHVDVSLCLGNITENLAARDFTINAMAVPLSFAFPKIDFQHLIDPYNGLEDIESKRIESIADTVFREDPIRLLRAVRFISQLQFDLSDNTRALIYQYSNLLAGVSNERIREEFVKIIQGINSSDNIRTLDELGLLSVLIPELDDCRGVTQPKEHFWDVLGHSINMPTAIGIITRDGSANIFGHDIIAQVPWNIDMDDHFRAEFSDGASRATILKIAGLLHDISKPSTKTFDKTKNKIRFIGHDKQGSKISEGILRRLRFSNKAIEFVSVLVNQHLRPTQMSSSTNKPSDRAIYRYYRDLGECAVDTLYLNLADYLSAKKATKIEKDDWVRHCDLIKYIFEHRLNRKPDNSEDKRLLNGDLIIQEFHIQPGPIIGYVLDLVYEEQISGNIKDVESALAFARDILSRPMPK